jgi:hypothetical protein
MFDRFIDIADYLLSNPDLLDSNFKGIWLGSRPFGAVVASALTPNDDSSRPRRRCHLISGTCRTLRTQERERICFQVIQTYFVCEL